MNGGKVNSGQRRCITAGRMNGARAGRERAKRIKSMELAQARPVAMQGTSLPGRAELVAQNAAKKRCGRH